MTEEDDAILSILMPTDPGEGHSVTSSAIASNYGWGSHIYSKGNGGTHTWDSSKYPDGTPGPAPDPGTPSSTPGGSGTPATPGDGYPDGGDPTGGDPTGGTGTSNGYNITIIKFYESDGKPESNFTRENNPGSIQVEDEPMYHLVDWYFSPDRVDPPSQSTSYDDTKAKCLITDTGTDPTTVNVVNPDTTLYLKLVKQGPPVQRPQVDFVLKESEITKAYNSQQVKTTGWKTGAIFHWSGSSLDGSCSYGEWRGHGDDEYWWQYPIAYQ